MQFLIAKKAMMAKACWFKNWFNSSYYYQLYSNRNEQEAQEFINTLIAYLQPATGATMLDVACGKGRHSKALAELGYDVTGIDLSVDAIAEALEMGSHSLQFFVHDMRNPFWVNYFDFAFNFFTSFGYFRTKREDENAIRTIANSLKANGIFVIDYLNIASIKQPYSSQEEKVFGEVIYKINKWDDDRFIYKDIKIYDPENDPNTYTYTEKVAKFSLAHFTKIFNKQGLTVQAVFGDYQLNSYNEFTSPRIIIVAKKMMN